MLRKTLVHGPQDPPPNPTGAEHLGFNHLSRHEEIMEITSISMPPSRRKPYSLCVDVLKRGFNANDTSLPLHIHTITGSTTRPDLDIIRQSAKDGCPVCAEMVLVHWTKVCNGYDGTTREEDAEEGLEAVATKFPRISVGSKMTSSLLAIF